MHDMFTTPQNDPTLREFHFTCKIDVIRKSVKQGEKGGTTEFEQVFLVPDTTDQQAIDFLNAWLLDEPQKTKDGKPKYAELLINVDREFGQFRVGVDRANEYYHEGPHLVVMSLYLEDKLSRKKGKKIKVKALSASDDVKDDSNDEPDTDRAVERIGEAGLSGL